MCGSAGGRGVSHDPPTRAAPGGSAVDVGAFRRHHPIHLHNVSASKHARRGSELGGGDQRYGTRRASRETRT